MDYRVLGRMIDARVASIRGPITSRHSDHVTGSQPITGRIYGIVVL